METCLNFGNLNHFSRIWQTYIESRDNVNVPWLSPHRHKLEYLHNMDHSRLRIWLSCLQPHYQDLYEIWVDHVVLLVVEESSLPLKHSSIPVKMCSDSHSLSSIPSNLLVYVSRIVKM